MSVTLILNAAEGRLQILLAQETTLLCVHERHAPSQGAELLTPLVADGLRRLGFVPKDIGLVACVVGPGSFTGLRLALTTAAGLRRAVGARTAEINYLQALAAGLCESPGTRARVLTHARQGLVHAQDFLLTETLPVPLNEPISVSPDQAARMDDVPSLVLGSGLDRNRAFFETAFTPAAKRPRLLAPRWSTPVPAALLELALAAEVRDEDLVPLYVRPCDAEDNLDALAARRGQSGAEARAELHRILALHPTS